MKESSAKRSVKVGIFIFAGLVIFAIAILVLGGQRKSFMKSVQVKAMFDDVGGLSKGNNIWYSGVKVGTIKSITFMEHNKIEVMMNIEKSARPYIHKDVKAKVSTDGLVGNKIIALSGGTAQAAPIENGDLIAVATSVSTDELMNTLQVNNKNLVDITGNLKEVTRNILEGQGTLGKLLKDTSVYTQLNGTLALLNKTAANTQRLTAGLADYSSKLQTKGTLANDLVSDTIVFARLRSTAGNLEQVAQDANTMVANLKTATSGLDQQLKSDQSAAGVILNDEETARNLKQTIRNLESSTGRLNENMEALKHNFLFRGYFRRQEKKRKKELEQQQRNAPAPAPGQEKE
jgi:phospholipid/cholesterol/gamma-HCH transport system substrate-binding protein